MVRLEMLANELIYEIFRHFDAGSLASTFFGLNRRFNRLVIEHISHHPLNLKFISKTHFDLLCNQILPFTVHEIFSLYLSSDETPYLTELLLDHGFTLDRFTRLKSLTLSNINSIDTLIKIISGCESLTQLTKLTIIQQEQYFSDNETYLLLRQIWNLPYLFDCHLDGLTKVDLSLKKIDRTSLTIDSLWINGITCNPHSLYDICQLAPNLRKLSLTIYSYIEHDIRTIQMPSVTTLRLTFGGSFQLLEKICRTFPNLNKLTFRTSKVTIDGKEWEKLIRVHLPQLKQFQLIMEFIVDNTDESMDIAIEDILNTFKSQFWIDQHRWFVRCHWSPSDPYRWAILYTLPYAFHTFDYSTELRSKSTCLNEIDDDWLMKPMKSVKYVHLGSRLAPDRSPIFPNCFRYVSELDIYELSHNQQILSIPPFPHLISLSICVYHDSCFDNLQIILNQAPKLYSLKLRSSVGPEYRLFELYSRSIRSLDLRKIRFYHTTFFSERHCQRLTQSSLGDQCEVLRIGVQGHQSILHFIRRMINLRILIIECEKNQSFLRYFSFSSPNLFTWLKDHLLPTDVIIQDSISPFSFKIWLDRQARKTSNKALTKRHVYNVNDYLKLF